MPSPSGSGQAPAPAQAPPLPGKAGLPEAAIPPDQRVPLREKWAYGAGGIGGALSQADNQLVMPIFVEVLGLSPLVISLRGVLDRVWDGLSDFAMGWATDATRTRWGRRKPYIAVGAVLIALLLPLMYFVQPSWSASTIIAWFIGCSLVLTLATSMWNIPYQCMLLEITPHSTERTNVAVWRAYVGKAGWLALGWVWYLIQLPVFQDAAGSQDALLGARWVLSGVGCVAMIFLLLPLFVSARVTTAATHAPRMSLRRNLQLTFANRPFLILLLFTVCFTLGFSLNGGLNFFTKLHYVFGGDQKEASFYAGIENTLAMVIGILGIPLFQRLARTRGKRFSLTAVMVVVLCSSLGTMLCYTPAYPALSMLPGLLLAPANTALWVLIPSMTGDVIDHDEELHHQRREGSFASTYSWFFKLAGSLAVAGSGPLVVLSGFDQHLPRQPEAVLSHMRLLLAIVPAICIVGSIVVLQRYQLTTERIAETAQVLARRRSVR